MLIPETVRATVLRRFRRLDRGERTVVMQASAIGLRFDVSVLTATAACDETRVRAALDRAGSLEIVRADEPARTRYWFHHAITREIIYAELLSSGIRPLHRRIARALEGALAAGEGSLADLAYHCWAAGDVRRTVRYNELAGDDAAAIHALDDARTYYARAQSVIEARSRAYVRLQKKLAGLVEA